MTSPTAPLRNRRMLTLIGAAVTAVAVVAAYLVLTAGPATADQFATLHVLDGTVEVGSGQAFEPGTEGQTLQVGQTVRTGSDGRAEIEYFDGSLTRLDVGTEFTLTELSTQPDTPGSKKIKGKQTDGRTLNRVVELTDSQSRFDVETPSAVASVRGTEYIVIVHPDDSSEIWVTDGVVAILLQSGEIIEVHAGQGIIIEADGTVSGIFEIDDEDLDGLCALDETFCPEDDVEGEVIERDEEEEETDDGTTVTQVETEDDSVELIPPLVIIRDGDDTTAPQTTITSGPDEESESETRSASFTASSNEKDSTFECKLDGGAFEECPGNNDRTIAANEILSGIEYDGLADGQHTFEVRATDESGNTDASPAVWRWTISAAPNTFIDDVSVLGRTATLSVSSDEDDVTYECAVDDGEFGVCDSPVVIGIERATQSLAADVVTFLNLTDGLHDLRVRAVDSTSKADQSPRTATVSISTPPNTTITSGPLEQTDDTSATFAFTADEDGVTFECRLDPESEDGWESCSSPETYEGLDLGTHTLEVRASDGEFTDSTPASRTWTIVEGAPPPGDIAITLTWASGPANLDLHVFAPNGAGHLFEQNTCLEGADGCWAELSADDTTAPGSETVTLRPSDAGFVAGTFTIRVENESCNAKVGYGGSGATVSISGGGLESTSFAVGDADGDQDAKKWEVAAVAVTPGGTASASAEQRLTGQACEEKEQGGGNDRVTAKAVASSAAAPEAAQDGAEGGNDGDDGSGGEVAESEEAPPATEGDQLPDGTPPEESETGEPPAEAETPA